MGLVKLVKNHATKSKTNKKSLQNRLQPKSLQNRPGGFYFKKSNICLLDTFSCEGLDFVARMNLPCQIFLLRKVLDFVESKILVWRAEVDLVMIFFVPDLGTLYRIGGSSTPPRIARGI